MSAEVNGSVVKIYKETRTQEKECRQTPSNITRTLLLTASLWQPNKWKDSEMATQTEANYSSIGLPAAMMEH